MNLNKEQGAILLTRGEYRLDGHSIEYGDDQSSLTETLDAPYMLFNYSGPMWVRSTGSSRLMEVDPSEPKVIGRDIPFYKEKAAEIDLQIEVDKSWETVEEEQTALLRGYTQFLGNKRYLVFFLERNITKEGAAYTDVLGVLPEWIKVTKLYQDEYLKVDVDGKVYPSEYIEDLTVLEGNISEGQVSLIDVEFLWDDSEEELKEYQSYRETPTFLSAYGNFNPVFYKKNGLLYLDGFLWLYTNEETFSWGNIPAFEFPDGYKVQDYVNVEKESEGLYPSDGIFENRFFGKRIALEDERNNFAPLVGMSQREFKFFLYEKEEDASSLAFCPLRYYSPIAIK